MDIFEKETEPNKINLEKAAIIDKAAKLYKKQQDIDQEMKELKGTIYNQYISEQKENFHKLLNFINENIVNDLNAEGKIILKPIRLEARIKSETSAIDNDSKARNPDDPAPTDGEKDSDLSDVFGITFIYTANPQENNYTTTLKKGLTQQKAPTKSKSAREIEALILDKINFYFDIYNSSRKKSGAKEKGFDRHYKTHTGYDSLHATGHLKDEFVGLLLPPDISSDDFEFQKEYIPQLEFHITEERVHHKASLDYYHILKFGTKKDRDEFLQAQKKKEVKKMNEILKNITDNLQEKFDAEGYDFLPKSVWPEMYASTDSGKIRKLELEGLHGTVKKLLYFLDISGKKNNDFKYRLKPENFSSNSPIPPANLQPNNTQAQTISQPADNKTPDFK